ncbi:MAG: hypothetical protein LBU92_01365, partial [Prevotellaceae bacterium]|nr:hypothetical protein [Prevotellaceae bacterium]
AEVIKKAEEVMRQYRCSYLYLATEDASIYSIFVEHFGSKLILDDAAKWQVADLQKGKSNANRTALASKEEKYKSGLEYLSQIYLLSRCTCFIAGNTRGSLGAMLMSNKFEYLYIYNLGVYK